MKLVKISDKQYEEYRVNAIFDAYKWDPQYIDNNVVGRYALVLTKSEASLLESYTSRLATETMDSEEYILSQPALIKQLGLPRKIRKFLKTATYSRENNVRHMRFDFHPVVSPNNTSESIQDFVLSEVNSDVPGGFAECSVLPKLMNQNLNNEYNLLPSFGDLLVSAMAGKLHEKKVTASPPRLALVHCTSYCDDRQVMQMLADMLQAKGISPMQCASDHINFKGNDTHNKNATRSAYSILSGNGGDIDFIFRFIPLEWMIKQPKAWAGYFNTTTPQTNHPISIFWQTKKIALILDHLDVPTWKALLPHTVKANVKVDDENDYIYKLAFGRIGMGISIKDALSKKEFSRITKDARRHPKHYIKQKRFNSMPIYADDGTGYHICVGVYSIGNKAAGFYARMSDKPLINSNAVEVPVLVEK